jgi:cytoskeletal protein CcmA (bactofilin family)
LTSETEERVPVVEVRVPGVTIGRSRAVVDKNLDKPHLNIFPESVHELDREIHVGSGAKIGRVFGKKVVVEKGTASRITEVASAVGLEEISVEGYSHINGPLLSVGKITVGPYTVVYGDIVAQETFIKEKCLVKGNILTRGNLNISDNARIYGVAYSQAGGIAIGENSVVFDAIAQGDLVVGAKSLLLDSAVWSGRGKIVAEKIKLRSLVDPKIADSSWELYDVADGLESSRIPAGKTSRGELNSSWVTVRDDLTARNDLVELIKNQWATLYNIAWELTY